MRKELQKSSLRRAIREKCLDCCCGQEKEVKICMIKKCSLWPYRMNNGLYQDPVTGENFGALIDEEVIKEEEAV